MKKEISGIDFSKIESDLLFRKIPFAKDFDLSKLCSFKIGGIAPLLVEPENEETLISFLSYSKNFGIPYKVLGGGSNVLISDYPNDFITLRLGGVFKEFHEKSEGRFEIGSAINTTPTFRKISNLGYEGVEFLSTIPGWVGGAVIQNAGCYGGEIFDFIQSVDVIQNNNYTSLPVEKIKYGYRSTEFLKNKNTIITRIVMNLKQGDSKEIEFKLKEFREKRNSSQPENKKSAGSVFKNSDSIKEKDKKWKAWELIDLVGMRGAVSGDAQVSEKHCNFIVNNGNALSRDVKILIEKIEDLVFKKFNIQLEKEIEFFGSMD